MGWQDMREWMETLEGIGELHRIKAEVDWNLELGGITRKMLDARGPALLFENIKGYQDSRCRRLFTSGLGTRERLSMMLGLPRSASIKEQIQRTRQRFKESVEPVRVGRGPVKENILKGNEVDLLEFPIPQWHHWDGGRYINTLCGIITRDPDSGQQNVGLYRGMLVDGRRIAMPISASQGIGLHFTKYRQMGKPMPIAVAYGWDPVLGFAASAGLPASVDEYRIMGAIRQQPVELVRCETNDLEVPASAEIVVEGSVSPDPKHWEHEGPFGEYTGYYGGTISNKPVMQVECITHRHDPIFRGTLEGMGPSHPNEDGVMVQVSMTAVVWNQLELSGVPGVRDVYFLPASNVTNLAIQIHQTYRGQAKQVGLAVWGSGIPMWIAKNVMVVDDDIDIHDFEALEWALAYRVNPGEHDLVVVHGLHGGNLDPSTRLEQRDHMKYGSGKWNRLLIDATKNWDYGPQEQYGGGIYPPVAFDIDPEIEALMQRRWREYSLPLTKNSKEGA